MAVQDETVQTLTRLGLTLCQAKVYLALVRSGIATAKAISKASSVTREDVYRIAPTLQKLGLVERAISSPVAFRAVPIQEGVSILIARKREEYDKLQAKTKELLRNFKNNSAKMPLLEEENTFVLIPGRERVIQRRLKEIDAAQTSVDVITLWKRNKEFTGIYIEDTLKALKRGVVFRVITEKPEKNSFTDIIQPLRNNPSYKIRHVLNVPNAIVTVYDRKNVLLSTYAEASLGNAPALWSNNPSLVGLAENYFEMMWTASTGQR